MDLNKVIETIRNLGATVVKPPAQTDEGYSTVVEDSDGRKIELN